MTLPAVGDILAGKYKIVKLLGKGGMGVVFLARHEMLRQHVAIKMVLPEVALDPVFVARFMNEARAAAGIRNEHVAQVLDVASLESGAPYMVLEYLEGHDLSDVLTDAKGDLAIETSVDWILEALEAVAQAHALGIIHRDLKPANLFLATRQDGSRVIKVLDFGISKATNPGDVNDVAVTSTQALLGSPGYMAPEQIRSSKNVDARADVWSVGVILYKLLTKVEPFVGDSFGALFGAIFSEDPVPVHERRPDVPAALEDVVMRCLAREREQRFPNVADLARSLAPFASVEGRASIERVCRTLGVSASAAVAPAPPPTSSPPTPSAPDHPALSEITGASPDAAAARSPISDSSDRMGSDSMGDAASAMPASQVQTVMDASLSSGPPEVELRKAKGRATMMIAAAVVVFGVGVAAVVAIGATGKHAAGSEGAGMVPSGEMHAASSAPSASAEAPMPSAEPSATSLTAAAGAGSASASASAVAVAATAPKKPPVITGTGKPAVPAATPSVRPTASAKPTPSAKPKPPDDSVLGGGRN